MDYNKTIITGRLTNDPELKQTTTGKAVCTFTVAVNGKGEKADFLNCVSWDMQAEFVAAHTKKGTLVLVDGRISNRSWEDKNGNKRITTEIIAEKVNLLGKKEEDIIKDEFADITADDEALPF